MEYNKEELISFIKNNFSSSEPEIVRCLNKANYIEFDKTNMLICDNTTIYYFCSTKPISKGFMKFYNDNYPKMKGKLFFSYNIGNYSNRCRRYPMILDRDPKKKAYIWL